MLSLTILGSGSSGNSAVVTTPQTRILVDAGLSARQICLRLEKAGVEPDSLDAILLSHEHSDHICGLDVFCRRHAVPIYCNPITAEAVRHGRLAEYPNWRLFSTGNDFTVNDIAVRSFSIPHDAADPVAFSFSAGTCSLGIVTDLGFATRLVRERIREVHTLVLETNHDEKLLQEDTKRPWPIKQRIMSRHGHLSNSAAADVLSEVADGALRRVILGHLSSDCNRPELALDTIRARMKELGRSDIELTAASPTEVSGSWQVG